MRIIKIIRDYERLSFILFLNTEWEEVESKKYEDLSKAKLVNTLSRKDEYLGLWIKTIHLNPKTLRKYPKKWDHHKEEIIIDGLVLFKIIFKKDKKKDLWLTSIIPRLFM